MELWSDEVMKLWSISASRTFDFIGPCICKVIRTFLNIFHWTTAA